MGRQIHPRFTLHVILEDRTQDAVLQLESNLKSSNSSGKLTATRSKLLAFVVGETGCDPAENESNSFVRSLDGEHQVG